MSDSEGKILPNLQITVKDDGTRTEDSLEEGELSNQEDIVVSDEIPNRKISLNWDNDVKNNPSKIYFNKNGFETGLDLSSSNLDQLKVRAERFGITEEEQRNVTQVELNDLYKSLGVDPKSLESRSKHIRLNTVHIRGVKAMFPQDLFKYFQDYCPSDIDWVDDHACNVLFPDEAGAARALLGLSKPYTIKTKEKLFEGAKDTTSEAGMESYSLEEKQKKELDIEDKIPIIDLTTESNDSDVVKADSMDVDNCEKNDIFDEPDIPLPPGYWRKGRPHKLAKSLYLRFATKDDKKIRGAERYSAFYKQNGNPNYGGLKGLISASKRRKFKAARTRRMVNNLSGNKRSLNEHLFSSGSQKRTKTLKMKMYADEEEEQLRRRESSKKINNQRSVKSRIGFKYERIELGRLGTQRSDNEDTEVTKTLNVTCKIPSNFVNNIWEDQSRKMAEEDEKYLRKNYDSSASSDSDDNERYYAFNSERAEYDAMINNMNSDSIYFQDTFKSGRGIPETKADLRSRINTLKKDSHQKHRSPLCREDSE